MDQYSGEEVTKLLIGNKDDVKGAKVVDPEQAREFAAEHNMLFMEASAMRATNVSAAFRLLVAEVGPATPLPRYVSPLLYPSLTPTPSPSDSSPRPRPSLYPSP